MRSSPLLYFPAVSEDQAATEEPGLTAGWQILQRPKCSSEEELPSQTSGAGWEKRDGCFLNCQSDLFNLSAKNVTTTDYHFTDTTWAFVKVHLEFCLFSFEGFFLRLSHRVVTADMWREEAAVRRHEAAIFDFIVVIKVFKFPTTNVANIETKATILESFYHIWSLKVLTASNVLRSRVLSLKCCFSFWMNTREKLLGAKSKERLSFISSSVGFTTDLFLDNL